MRPRSAIYSRNSRSVAAPSFSLTPRVNGAELDEVGAARFWIAGSTEEATEIIGALIRQKKRKYQETHAPDLFAERGYRAFFASLIERHMSSGLIHASALSVDGTMVATHFGMIFRDRMYWLMPGHEAGAWSRYSVGRLHMQRLLEWSIEQSLKTFDFTVGDEAYKKLWSDEIMSLHEYKLGLTGKGQAFLRAYALGRVVTDRVKHYNWAQTLLRLWSRGRGACQNRMASGHRRGLSGETHPGP